MAQVLRYQLIFMFYFYWKYLEAQSASLIAIQVQLGFWSYPDGSAKLLSKLIKGLCASTFCD